MCFSFSYSWSISLLLQSHVNNSSTSHHLFLFTYANSLLITCDFRFNIYDLFVCFFKVISTTVAQVNTCFYLLMQIVFLLDMVFVVIFSVYLFIYSKRCPQKQVEPPPVFIYLCKWLVLRHGFRFNIQYLFVYLFKAMSTKAGGSDHLFLFTYANCLFLYLVFVVIFSVYLFIYSKRCQQKQV